MTGVERFLGCGATLSVSVTDLVRAFAWAGGPRRANESASGAGIREGDDRPEPGGGCQPSAVVQPQRHRK
jgi:hypothetical protein